MRFLVRRDNWIFLIVKFYELYGGEEQDDDGNYHCHKRANIGLDVFLTPHIEANNWIAEHVKLPHLVD